ncbi:MAG: hypothetical protein J5701_01890 [Bacteroidales bacterium]|nr:hypothetical protein [Bacteroidales bacterium]
MKKIVYVFVIGSLMLNSCSRFSESPKKYQKEIEDYCRYRIALAKVAADDEYYNKCIGQKLDSTHVVNFGTLLTWGILKQSKDWYYNDLYVFDSEITNETYFNGTNGDPYRNALFEKSIDSTFEYKALADETLTRYIMTEVVLSDYISIPTSSDFKIWEFTELKTGLVGRFTTGGEIEGYRIEFTDSSWEEFWNNLIQ